MSNLITPEGRRLAQMTKEERKADNPAAYRGWIKFNVWFWGHIGVFTVYCVVYNLVH